MDYPSSPTSDGQCDDQLKKRHPTRGVEDGVVSTSNVRQLVGLVSECWVELLQSPNSALSKLIPCQRRLALSMIFILLRVASVGRETFFLSYMANRWISGRGE
ncbi:hypothetical protein AB1N83_003349 [Pleurotus pulmonarius]